MPTTAITAPSADFARRIQEECGENVYLCYQCKKCTAGCPVAAYFDLAPHQVLRACQLGQRERVLSSRTIWICAACETCSTRCPQGIDLARIMDVLKIMAQREGIKPRARPVLMFYKAANRTIDWFGRLWELGLMAELYIRMLFAGELNFRQLLRRDLPLALKMMRRGKLKLLPSRAKRPRRAKVSPPDAISYYPGCSLHSTGIEFDLSTRAVAEILGLKLIEPEGWVCCGTSPAHSTDHFRSIKLPLQTLAIAQKMGYSYMTVPCASCFSRFRNALHEVGQDPELRERVATAVGYEFSKGPEVDSLLTTMTERVGYEAIRQAVVKPLSGLKVVSYYGCLLTRPPEVTGAEHYEYPMNMDRLMEALGAESLDWSYKTECCGGSLSLTQLPIALEMSRKILQNAKEVGAEAIVVACPLCHANLDLRQSQIAGESHEEFDLPILYFTQVMGMAFGLAPQRLGLEKHFVDPLPLLKRKGFLEVS